MSEDVKSKIADLEKELYSKGFKAEKIEDTFVQRETQFAPKWNAENDAASLQKDSADAVRRHNIMKKFVKFSIGFFIITLAVTAFIWLLGTNVVSGEKIDIDISQPQAVSGGEPFETKFTITNKNLVSVDAATLLVEYPAGFYSAVGNTELLRKSKDLGMVAPGQSISESIKTVLYGQENTNKEISVTLEYRMSGSNATLKKSTTYTIGISSAPINMSLNIPKEISSGQETVVSIEIGSNSRSTISGLVVEAAYPAGFNFRSADPAPFYGTNIWHVSALKPLEKRTITIRGVIEGQEKEEKVTKVSVGTKSLEDDRRIGVVYTEASESSIITRPFLALDVSINNNKSKEYVATLGNSIQVDLLWRSNNNERVNDAVIEVKLKGDILDKYSLYASGGGFYRSIDNTIIWNRAGNQELGTIEPGAGGSVSFSFSPISLGIGSARTVKNPQIIFEVTARAKRSDSSSIPGDIVTSITRNIKFATDLRLDARGLFFTGPFENTGELPPKADKQTSYTIAFTVKNSSNSVSDANVKTTLPIYVKWLGKVDPTGEDVTYNEATSEVFWSVGRIPSGGTRDAAFQVSFMPSISQINTQPKLIGDVFLTAKDDFTKAQVVDRKGSVTTYLPSDPQVGQNQATVVK